jgi:hypothetical protein
MPEADCAGMNSESTTETAPGGTQAPFGPTLALVAAVSVGAFLVIAPLARWILPATALPAPFPAHHQDAETLVFVLAFVVILPVACIFVPRVADGIAEIWNEATVSLLAAISSAGLVLAAAVIRVAGSADLVVGLAGGVWLAFVAVLLLASADGRIAPPAALTSRRRTLWWAGAAGALALMLSFSAVGSIALVPFIVGTVAVGVGLYLSEEVAMPSIGPVAGRLVDGGVIVLILLAVPNLVVYESGSFSANVENTIIHFHQNFFLGPANQVLGGSALLIDVLSQYGVGSIYFLTAMFQLIPIGGGTLGLIEGALSALMFTGGYLVARAAGASRMLAATGLLVAILVFVYGLVYPLGALLQHGAIRFGLPMAVLVGAMIELRWPRYVAWGRALQLITLAVASIWALEAFAYTLFTSMAVIAASIWLLPAEDRRSGLIRRVVEVVVAIVAAHVTFNLLTLLITGELPRWGWYIATLREFLAGPVGDLTYDFSRWSPGVALGILYFCSAAAFVLMLRRRPEVARRFPAMTVAIAGTTAMGIALFSYLVNRSADHIVPYISLPAVMLAVLWITLIRRPGLAIDAALRRAALAAALFVSVLMIAVAYSSIGTRFSESALGLAFPGGSSFTDAVDKLWNPPPTSEEAAEGARLLESRMPDEQRSLVLTDADLSLEILLLTGRSNELPMGDPWEDSIVPDGHLEGLQRAIDELEPGTRMLVDEAASDVFRRLAANPDRDPIDDPIGSSSLVPTGLANIQQWVLQRIGERFRLREVAAGGEGLRVVELVPRQ